MKTDFNTMTKAELRAYVLAHRDDREAFQALADRIYANQNPQWYQPEETGEIADLLAATKTNNNISG
jgi:hypothetical protein